MRCSYCNRVVQSALTCGSCVEGDMHRLGSVSALMIGDALVVAGTLPDVGRLVGGCSVTQDEPGFTVQGSGA
jgi:hypothetical protein